MNSNVYEVLNINNLLFSLLFVYRQLIPFSDGFFFSVTLKKLQKSGAPGGSVD